ncbi:ATP-binding Cassette (ABC) Superfamily [Achlya hypogyna]|uniref:ATP-binding Cassette (ABC) Superfamily n=1 Tax=Achlya hypogyna TaxID=1202772 RepID=A0A1V9YIU4_ACHHY|nr:ATP-binding Cassette (ABC) Superfamily [Achlya hypogyna]
MDSQASAPRALRRRDRENITGGLANTYGVDDLQARVEETRRAAKVANASQLRQPVPRRLQTQVGLKGEQLSGGQKQRIPVARAIIKNSVILLLDETTNALDSESEIGVQETLDKLLVTKAGPRSSSQTGTGRFAMPTRSAS